MLLSKGGAGGVGWDPKAQTGESSSTRGCDTDFGGGNTRHHGAEGSSFLPSFFSSSLCRVAMCVGKCSRIVGPCLLALGTLSVAANVLLLLPSGASKYLLEGHISKHAKAMPGIWGGGVIVSTAVCSASLLVSVEQGRGGGEQVAPLCPPAVSSFLQVLLAATHITAVGWRCAGCSDCGTRSNVRQRQRTPKRHVVGCWRWPQGGLWYGATPPMACSGWPLACGGLWQGATSPVALRWGGARCHFPKGRASPACRHGLCPNTLWVATPSLSPCPACSCPAQAERWLHPQPQLPCLEPLGKRGRGVLTPY